MRLTARHTACRNGTLRLAMPLRLYWGPSQWLLFLEILHRMDVAEVAIYYIWLAVGRRLQPAKTVDGWLQRSAFLLYYLRIKLDMWPVTVVPRIAGS